MTDKPYASLSSGLLARKGGAKPAMRPQGFNSFGSGGFGGGSLEDLGWNDMGPADEFHPHQAPIGLTPASRGPVPLHEVARQEPHYDEPASEAESFESRSFEDQPSEGQSFEGQSFEGQSFEGRSFEDQPSESQPSEDQSFEDQPFEDQAFDEHSFDEQSFDEAEDAEEARPPLLRGPLPPVVRQQRALRESFAEADVVALPRRRAAPSGLKSKAAFTLRLDPERHLKLRLASAVTHLSAQQLVTGALDDFLNSLPELEALADRVPAEAGQRSR